MDRGSIESRSRMAMWNPFRIHSRCQTSGRVDGELGCHMASRFRFAAIVLMVVSCVANPLSAQGPAIDAALSADSQFGFNILQLLLEEKGLRSGTDFNNAVDQPEESVIVLLGELDWLDNQDWNRLYRFVQGGGALLVATDRAIAVSGMFRIQSGPIEVAGRYAYQGFSDCPVIERGISNTPLTRDVDQIIGNRSGWISATWSSLGRSRPVATLPSFRKGNRRFLRGGFIQYLETSDFDPGRLLVAADHSIFVNGMLWHGSNAMLAINTVDWLTDGPNRQRLYFNVDGEASRSGLQFPPIPPDGIPPEAIPESLEDIPPFSIEDLLETPPESLFTFGNSLINGLQDENVFNQLLAHSAVDLPRDEYMQQLYVTAAFMAGFWLFKQLSRRGRRFDVPVHRTNENELNVRSTDVLKSRDLRQPLRELARELFRTLAGSEDHKNWAACSRGAGVSGLRRLELIATDIDRKPISRRHFRRLTRTIEHIREMHENGVLTGTPDQSVV